MSFEKIYEYRNGEIVCWGEDVWGNKRLIHTTPPSHVRDCFTYYGCDRVASDGFRARPLDQGSQREVVVRETVVVRERPMMPPPRQEPRPELLIGSLLGTALGMALSSPAPVKHNKPKHKR